MSDFPFDLVGFDLDGTLLDTSGDLAAAVNHALQLAGREPLTVAQIRPKIGGGAKNMLRMALDDSGGCDEERFAELHRELLRYYEAHIAVHSHAFDGLLTTLDALHGRGVKTAIVTNKFESLAEKLMREIGLRNRFACLIGGDTMGKGLAKPNRAPIDEMIRRCGGGRTAFVGDSIYDVQAAKNAGIPVVAVSFGFVTGRIEDLGADAVIDHYAELIPALESLA